MKATAAACWSGPAPRLHAGLGAGGRLATGGAGKLYRETTNPPVATGDGHAMAYRAGAELRDMEFMQFHPTVLYIAGSSRHLLHRGDARRRGLSPRLQRRALHARLSSAPNWPRATWSPWRSPRRWKRRSIRTSISTWRHLDAERMRRRFPGIDRLCRDFGLDITRDPIPVCPGAHYMIGGVTVDLDGRTTVPGLWAAGEVTSRPARRQPAGLEQPARRPGFRQPRGRRHRPGAGLSRAPAARGPTDFRAGEE